MEIFLTCVTKWSHDLLFHAFKFCPIPSHRDPALFQPRKDIDPRFPARARSNTVQFRSILKPTFLPRKRYSKPIQMKMPMISVSQVNIVVVVIVAVVCSVDCCLILRNFHFLTAFVCFFNWRLFVAGSILVAVWWVFTSSFVVRENLARGTWFCWLVGGQGGKTIRFHDILFFAFSRKFVKLRQTGVKKV